MNLPVLSSVFRTEHVINDVSMLGLSKINFWSLFEVSTVNCAFNCEPSYILILEKYAILFTTGVVTSSGSIKV